MDGPFLMHRRSMLIVILVAMVLRCAPVIYKEISSPQWHEKNVNEIAFYYDDVARSLIAGEGFVHSVRPNIYTEWKFSPGTPFHFVPPLYLWFVAFVYFIFGPNVFLITIFTALIDSLVCALVYLIGKKIFNMSSVPLISAALYAVYPLSVVMAGRMYYQIFLNITLCWLIYCLLSPSTSKNAIYTGLAFGMATLAKPITLPLLFFIPLAKTLECFKGYISSWNLFKWTSVFLLVGIAVLTPWTLRNYFVFDEFIPVQRGGPVAFLQGSKIEYIETDVKSLRVEHGDELSSANKTAVALGNHLNHLTDNPLSYVTFLAKKFSYAWFNTEGREKNMKVLLIQIPFLFLAFLGFVSKIEFWFKGRNWYVVLAVLYVVSIQVAIFPLVRYTLAVMPIVMIFSAVGLYLLLNLNTINSFKSHSKKIENV